MINNVNLVSQQKNTYELCKKRENKVGKVFIVNIIIHTRNTRNELAHLIIIMGTIFIVATLFYNYTDGGNDLNG